MISPILPIRVTGLCSNHPKFMVTGARDPMFHNRGYPRPVVYLVRTPAMDYHLGPLNLGNVFKNCLAGFAGFPMDSIWGFLYGEAQNHIHTEQRHRMGATPHSATASATAMAHTSSHKETKPVSSPVTADASITKHHNHNHHNHHGHQHKHSHGRKHSYSQAQAEAAKAVQKPQTAAEIARNERKAAFEAKRLAAIAEVRKRYTDIDPSVDDHEISRFVVARSFDIDATIEMHRKQAAWRKKNGIDELPVPGIDGNPLLQNVRGFSSVADGNFDKNAEGVPEYLLKWYDCLGGGCFHKTDNNGHPIFIERTGYHDVKGLGSKCPPDQLLDWHVRNNEFIFNILMKECSEKAGTNVDKHVVIFDCQGLGLWQFDMKGMSLLKALSDLDSKVYPERLSKLFIVNTPSIFSKAWNLIKGWVDPGILEKIFICGSDYKEVLRKHVPEENLPAFLGGKCLCNFPGGCVPSPYLEAHGGQDPDFMSTITMQTAKHQFEFTVPEDEENDGVITYKFRSNKKVTFDIKRIPSPGEKEIPIVKPKAINQQKEIIEEKFDAAKGTYIFTWEKISSGFSLFSDSAVLDYTVDFVSKKPAEVVTGGIKIVKDASLDSLSGASDICNETGRTGNVASVGSSSNMSIADKSSKTDTVDAEKIPVTSSMAKSTSTTNIAI